MEKHLEDLRVAIEENIYSEVKRIISMNPSLMKNQGLFGSTPLHTAVKHGHLKIVKLFLSMGAQPQWKDEDGDSPIHTAALVGDTEMINLFLEYETSIDLKNNNGWTPLHYAALEGNMELAAFLVEKGADTTIKDNDNSMTPALLAAAAGYELVGQAIQNNDFTSGSDSPEESLEQPEEQQNLSVPDYHAQIETPFSEPQAPAENNNSFSEPIDDPRFNTPMDSHLDNLISVEDFSSLYDDSSDMDINTPLPPSMSQIFEKREYASPEPVEPEQIEPEQMGPEQMEPESLYEPSVIKKPVIKKTVIQDPIVEIIEEPVIDEPIIEKPVIDEPVIEKQEEYPPTESAKPKQMEPEQMEPESLYEPSVIQRPVIQESIAMPPRANNQIMDFVSSMVKDAENEQAAKIDDPVIEEPVIDEPIIEKPVIDEPVSIPDSKIKSTIPQKKQNQEPEEWEKILAGEITPNIEVSPLIKTNRTKDFDPEADFGPKKKKNKKQKTSSSSKNISPDIADKIMKSLKKKKDIFKSRGTAIKKGPKLTTKKLIDDEALWKNSMKLARSAIKRGDYKVAEMEYREAIEKATKMGANHINLGWTKVSLAFILRKNKKRDEAETHFKEAYKILDANLEPHDPEKLKVLLNLSLLQIENKNLIQAVGSIKKTLSIIKECQKTDKTKA